MRIVAPYVDGPREVEVFATPTPGLVIGEDADRAGHWMVMHRSGTQVADLPNPQMAHIVAVRLGGLGNWNRPAAKVAADRTLQQRWSMFMYRSGLADRFRCRAANPDEMAQAESQTTALNRRGQ